MRDIVFIPIRLIKEAEQDNWLRSASYFVRLKSLYRNNTHYKFSLRSLGDKIKCSPACLAVHLQVLQSKGLITYHSGNITFAGLKKMQSKFGTKNIGVPIDNINNFKNQFDILRGQIIRFNLSSQAYNIKKNGITLSNHTRLMPSSKNETFRKSSYTGLTAKGVGSLFGLSLATGSRVRKKLDQLSIVKTVRVYSILFKNKTLSDYYHLRNIVEIPFYSFFSNGNIFIERRPVMEYCMVR